MVPARVRGCVLDAGSGCRLGERAPHAGVAQDLADAVYDDQIAVGRERCGEAALAKSVGDLVHHDHVSTGGVGLEWDALSAAAHLTADSDDLLLEVDVLPRRAAR
jgi:hypothetical protein